MAATGLCAVLGGTEQIEKKRHETNRLNITASA
jgi:hypothetical protein